MLTWGKNRMGIGRLFCASILAAAVVAASAWAETPLSGAQIEAHVSGNTLEITTKNLEQARGYFAPDGTIKGREGERDFAGKWGARNNRLCLDIPQFEHEFCRTVVVQGNHLLLFTETGQPAGRVDVTQGNPDQF